MRSLCGGEVRIYGEGSGEVRRGWEGCVVCVLELFFLKEYVCINFYWSLVKGCFNEFLILGFF